MNAALHMLESLNDNAVLYALEDLSILYYILTFNFHTSNPETAWICDTFSCFVIPSLSPVLHRVSDVTIMQYCHIGSDASSSQPTRRNEKDNQSFFGEYNKRKGKRGRGGKREAGGPRAREQAEHAGGTRVQRRRLGVRGARRAALSSTRRQSQRAVKRQRQAL